MIRFLDLQKQYESIKADIDDAIRSVIRDSAFIGGKYVQRFEEQFAAYQQSRNCVGVANGTDALEVAIQALDLPPGEILVPANTFIATGEAVTRSGHRVVFCDCDPETYTISVEDAARRIGAATRAVIAVHLYGHPCDMDALLELAGSHGLPVIEDCAQAHGAEYKGRRVGCIGRIGTFSFYPGKNLGAFGDAGAIVSNDDELAKRCRMIANHGRTLKYAHDFEGRNSRLDGLQAAILSAKLLHLDKWTALRSSVAAYYIARLRGLKGIVLPSRAPWAKHVWHLFVIRSQMRDILQSYLNDRGIQTGIHYPISLPKQRAYGYLGQNRDAMAANTFDDQILSLPMGEHLNENDLETVVSRIQEFTGSHSGDA